MEKIGSILFLLLFLGLPVVMVVALVSLAVGAIRRRASIVSFARRRGFEVLAGDDPDTQRLKGLLSPTLFAERGRRHSLKNVVRGRLGEHEAWVAHFRWSTPGTNKHGRGGRETIIVTSHAPASTRATIVPTGKGKIARMIARVESRRAVRLGDGWEWASVYAPDASAAEALLTSELGTFLRARLGPGEFLHLFRNLTVLAGQNERDGAWVEEALGRLDEILAHLPDAHLPTP